MAGNQDQNLLVVLGVSQRSGTNFQHAVNLVRDGRIGHIHRVEVGLPQGYAEPMGDTTIQSPPAVNPKAPAPRPYQYGFSFLMM